MSRKVNKRKKFKIEYVTPPDNSKTSIPNHYIKMEHLEAKGHIWVRQMKFTVETAAVVIDDRALACRYWAKPTYEVADCGYTGSWALDGSGWVDCMCKKCVKGRKEVKAGWRPK